MIHKQTHLSRLLIFYYYVLQQKFQYLPTDMSQRKRKKYKRVRKNHFQSHQGSGHARRKLIYDLLTQKKRNGLR